MMLKKMIKALTGGEFIHRAAWEAPPHSCRLPRGNRRDVWKCNCGKIYKCLGLSFFGDVIQWREIKEEDIHSEIDEKEIY